MSHAERKREHDEVMASKEEAGGGAWEGADLERTILGEDPDSNSLATARHWIAVYSHLVELEQELAELLARMIPQMPTEAQKEAQDTNLPVIFSQIERFRHRLDFWTKKKNDLEKL